MNVNQHMEFQYVNMGYPYSVAGGEFMGYYEHAPHAPEHSIYPSTLQNQESIYWPMNMNSYRFQLPHPGSSSYYSYFEVNNHSQRTEENQRFWEYTSETSSEEPVSLGAAYEERNVRNSVASSRENPDSPEERNVNHDGADNPEVVWQDNVDPDNMTYELGRVVDLSELHFAQELLDLGEAVGTESRGLSVELIKLLPTSRYKVAGFFSRKRTRERCVICLVTYKMGDQQIILPCKHAYHKKCGTKWLRISKVIKLLHIFSDQAFNLILYFASSRK